MNILITFEDGTTEERDAETPCLSFLLDPPTRHPSEERFYLYFPHERHPLSFCGLTVRTLDSANGSGLLAVVWRLTGHTENPYTLTGEWQPCRVETLEEQVVRLTRERDAAAAVADAVADAVAAYNRDEAASASDLFMSLRVHPAVQAWRK